MQNPVDSVAELRESADVLLQQAQESRGRMTPVTGRDESRQVTVELDKDGAVRDVRVGFAWDQKLSADQLAPAVMEAIADARTLHVEQLGEAYRETGSETRRARPAHDTVVAQLRSHVEAGGGTPAAAGRMVEQMLAEVASGLEEANHLLDEHASRRHRGRSRAGHVTAHALGNGDVSSVTYDAGWLLSAHPANIGRETTQAIAAAARTAQKEGLAASMQAGRLATFARTFLGRDLAGITTPADDHDEGDQR